MRQTAARDKKGHYSLKVVKHAHNIITVTLL